MPQICHKCMGCEYLWTLLGTLKVRILEDNTSDRSEASLVLKCEEIQERDIERVLLV